MGRLIPAGTGSVMARWREVAASRDRDMEAVTAEKERVAEEALGAEKKSA